MMITAQPAKSSSASSSAARYDVEVVGGLVEQQDIGRPDFEHMAR